MEEEYKGRQLTSKGTLQPTGRAGIFIFQVEKSLGTKQLPKKRKKEGERALQ